MDLKTTDLMRSMTISEPIDIPEDSPELVRQDARPWEPSEDPPDIPMDEQERTGVEIIDPAWNRKLELDKIMENPNIDEQTKIFYQLPLNDEQRAEVFKELTKNLSNDKYINEDSKRPNSPTDSFNEEGRDGEI